MENELDLILNWINFQFFVKMSKTKKITYLQKIVLRLD
jgi:hypothetical protein